MRTSFPHKNNDEEKKLLLETIPTNMENRWNSLGTYTVFIFSQYNLKLRYIKSARQEQSPTIKTPLLPIQTTIKTCPIQRVSQTVRYKGLVKQSDTKVSQTCPIQRVSQTVRYKGLVKHVRYKGLVRHVRYKGLVKQFRH